MRALAAVLVVLLTPGCLQGVLDLGAPPPVAVTIAWELTQCRYIVGWSGADAAKLQARMPEGFRVQRGSTLPGAIPTDVDDRPVLGVEAFQCASGSTLNGTMEGLTYASLFVGAAPSPEQKIEGINESYVKWDVLVPDDARRARLAALGASVRNGSIAWDAVPVPGGVGARLALEGLGNFTFRLTIPQQAQRSDGREFAEFTPTATDDLVVWRANFSWDQPTFTTGRGTIDWPAGSWAADAVGATQAPAQFHAGTWSFNGTVTLPPS